MMDSSKHHGFFVLDLFMLGPREVIQLLHLASLAVFFGVTIPFVSNRRALFLLSGGGSSIATNAEVP